MPPSISNLVSRLFSLIIDRIFATFFKTESINSCPPKPGKTDINKIISNLSKKPSNTSKGISGLRTSPALQPQSFIKSKELSTSSEASGWKVM